MRDALHFLGMVLATGGTALTLFEQECSLAVGAVTVAGALLAVLTHRAGEHGPPDGW